MHELGMVVEDSSLVASCLDYFDKLWQRSGDDLSNSQIDAWDETITEHHIRAQRPLGASDLGDFGTDTGFAPDAPSKVPTSVVDQRPKHSVKLLGTADNRVDPSFSAPIQEIERAGCHWAVCPT